MAMLGKAARSADVHADTAVRSWTLSARSLDELARSSRDQDRGAQESFARPGAEAAAGQWAHRRVGSV